MKNILLILSLGTNLVLAGWWLRPGATPTPNAITANRASAVSEKRTATIESSVLTMAVSNPPAHQICWADLQTDDLKEFIRRLRAVGCPEETLQDLVLAEVNRRYSARTMQLWPERLEVRPFWETQSPFDLDKQIKNRQRMRQEQALREEKSALLVDLLGVDPEKERRKADNQEDWQDRIQKKISFVPESKRDVVSKYLEDFEDKRQEFFARNRGLYDAEYRAGLRELEAEGLRGLSQFLTPEEVREYELRESQLANQLSHDLANVTVTREQYETIFDIRKKYGDSIYNYGDIESQEGRDQVQQTQKALKADLAAALGPDLSKQYERSQDYSYQQLARLAKRNDLPADTATKLFDLKDAAEQSIRELQNNQDISAAKRNDALQQIRKETENSVQSALGDALYKKYLRQGGWWINNLVPTPRPPRP